MKYFKLLSIFLLILTTLALAFAWTPPSDGEFYDFYALYNVTNITAEYIFQNDSQVCTAANGLCATGDTNTQWNITGSDWIYNNSGVLDWNETKANITYLLVSNENTLNVNSSNYWDAYDTPNDFVTVTATGLISALEFLGAQNWTYLQNYPSACPSGTVVTQIGDTIVCTALTAADIDPGTFPAGDYVFSDLLTATEFAGAQNWTDNQNYPSACTSSQTLTALGDTLTCGAISITESQVSDLQAYALIGDCPAGEVVQNTTASGVECVAPAGTGTVTSVATGNGLTGGPITTSGTISVSATTCVSGNYTYWNGSDFLCSAPPQGDITEVTTDGAYLTGGATSGAVALLLNETYLNNTVDDRGLIYLLNTGDTSTGAYSFAGGVTLNGLLDANGLITLGDNGDTVAIDSSSWDISTGGVITGASITESQISDLQGYALPGTCPAGQVVQNTTASGVECVEDVDTNVNIFDQSLNTTDSVEFSEINITSGNYYSTGNSGGGMTGNTTCTIIASPDRVSFFNICD